jgi:hypothetical protein
MMPLKRRIMTGKSAHLKMSVTQNLKRTIKRVIKKMIKRSPKLRKK